MNPARSLASALSANTWNAFWIYLAAPPSGMLAAVAVHSRVIGITPRFSQPKLYPNGETRGIHSGFDPDDGRGDHANARAA